MGNPLAEIEDLFKVEVRVKMFNDCNRIQMQRQIRTRPNPRAGSIYIVVMGTSLIVVCLAVASLQAVRVQRRINDELSQMANAKRLAQSGIEFAQHRILTDPSWRTYFTNGTPVTRTTTWGSFSVTLTDPDDGIIANQTTDPIVVTSTGTFGSASQKLIAYLEPQTQLFAACRSALYAPTNIAFNTCTITANQWAYSDSLISASSNPVVNMNCLAGSLSGSSSCFTQRAIAGGTWPMTKPDLVTTSSTYVGKYYIDNGVTINASDLPTGGTELIKNAGFVTDTSNWTPLFCTIAAVTGGYKSCLVTNRWFTSSTPVQDITEHMLKGRNYTVTFYVRPVSAETFHPQIVLYCSGSFVPIVLTGSPVSVNANAWKKVSSTINVTWSGVLYKADFQLGSTGLSDYNFVDASLLNLDRVAGTRYIENVVLGNAANPFGSKIVSANGMYSINAPGENLLIRDSRINASLVVQNASNVSIGNAVSWEPTGRNFPALIANAPIRDLTVNTSLSEDTIGVNLNPLGTAYRGVSDLDASDSYPSLISGAIVSTGDILLSGLSTLSGPVQSGTNINVTSSNLNINFQSDMILNPPPGFFADPPKMRLITSSLQP